MQISSLNPANTSSAISAFKALDAASDARRGGDGSTALAAPESTRVQLSAQAMELAAAERGGAVAAKPVDSGQGSSDEGVVVSLTDVSRALPAQASSATVEVSRPEGAGAPEKSATRTNAVQDPGAPASRRPAESEDRRANQAEQVAAQQAFALSGVHAYRKVLSA